MALDAFQHETGFLVAPARSVVFHVDLHFQPLQAQRAEGKALHQPKRLAAQALAPVLNDAVVAEMTCVGSLLIIGLGLNMLGVTKLKVMNYVPAVFVAIGVCYLF